MGDKRDESEKVYAWLGGGHVLLYGRVKEGWKEKPGRVYVCVWWMDMLVGESVEKKDGSDKVYALVCGSGFVVHGGVKEGWKRHTRVRGFGHGWKYTVQRARKA